MRHILTNTYKIDYPEDIIFLYDLNKIRIGGPSAGFNAKVTIQNPDGETSVLQYTTRTKSIMFILDDNLKYLWSKGNYDWSFTVTIDEVQIFSFSAKVLNGKSFLNKTHGSSDVIYLYDLNTTFDSRYIDVYAPNEARLVYGTTSLNIDYGYNRVYLPSLGIITTGDYNILMTNRSSDSLQAVVVSDSAKSPSVTELGWSYTLYSNGVVIDGGSLYRQRQIFPQTIKLHFNELCPSDVVLQYTNADGCLRQVCGKLIEEKDEFEPTRLNNVVRSEMYKFNPTFSNNNNSKTLKIGVYDIEAGAEVNDIIFSDTLQIMDINNTWTDCVLKTNSVTNYKNNGFDNLQFEIIISEL